MRWDIRAPLDFNKNRLRPSFEASFRNNGEMEKGNTVEILSFPPLVFYTFRRQGWSTSVPFSTKANLTYHLLSLIPLECDESLNQSGTQRWKIQHLRLIVSGIKIKRRM